MAVMAAAARAVIFGPGHPQLIVFFESQCARDVIEKARPAGAAIIFGIALENRAITAGAMEHALAFLIIQGGCERTFRRFLAEHLIGERAEALFPVRIGQLTPFAVCEIGARRVRKGLAGLACARTSGDQSRRGRHQKGPALRREEEVFHHAV